MPGFGLDVLPAACFFNRVARLDYFRGTRDRYQDALRELIETKLKGLLLKTQPARAPAPVIDLMSALKRSLAEEAPERETKPRPRAPEDRRQANLLLPVPGSGSEIQSGIQARCDASNPVVGKCS